MTITKKPIVADGIKFVGQTYCVSHTIVVMRDDDEEMATTLIHEIMHAVTCSQGLVHNENYGDNTTLPQQKAHDAIVYGSVQLTHVLLSNPDLLAYLRSVAASIEASAQNGLPSQRPQ